MPTLHDLIKTYEEEKVQLSDKDLIISNLRKIANEFKIRSEALRDEAEFFGKIARTLKPIIKIAPPYPTRDQAKWHRTMKEKTKQALAKLAAKKPKKPKGFLKKVWQFIKQKGPYIGAGAAGAGTAGYIIGYQRGAQKLTPYEKELMANIAAAYYYAGLEEAQKALKKSEFLEKLANFLETLDLTSQTTTTTNIQKEISNGIELKSANENEPINELESTAQKEFTNEILNMEF